jgi:hypothetical protein
VADKKAPCSMHREGLLEVFLSEGEKANLPPDLSRHLENCDACSRYWDNMGSVLAGYPKDPLYSPFLRAKTLRRLDNPDQVFKRRWVPLVVFAALVSISLSFVLPVWLLARLFMHWTSSAALAGGIALGILLLTGTLATVVSAISLIERGYIHFGNEDGIQGRAGFPSMAGNN